MQAILLARVSSKEQEEGHSLVAQLNRLHAYCDRKNLEISKEFILVESSTRGERPEFQKMITYIKNQRQKVALVCDKVDRLQRSFREVPVLEQLRKSDRLVLHFVSENQILDSGANNSQIMAYQIFVMMAENYTNCISDNVKRSFEKKIREGSILTYAPVGYLNTNINGENTVIVDPDRGDKIKTLFEKYATGDYSIRDLQLYASQIGLKSRKGLALSDTTIHQMLHNPFYYGMMNIKGKLYPHKYPILVTQKLFNACAKVANSRNKLPPAKSHRHFFLSGLVRCKYCKKLYSPYIRKNKYIYLTPPKSQYCNHERLSGDTVMVEIEKFLKSFHLSDTELQTALNELENKKAIEFEKYNFRLSGLQAELNRLKTRRTRLLDVFLDQSIDRFNFDKLDKELSYNISELESKISSYDCRLGAFFSNLKSYIKIANISHFLIKSSSFLKKKLVFKLVSSNCFIDSKNIVISARYPIKIPLNTRGCQIWGG